MFQIWKLILKKVYLHEIATVVPEHSYTQKFAVDFQLDLICKTDKQRKFLQKIYEGSAIYKRHTVIGDYGKDPKDFTFYPKNRSLKPEPSTKKRNDLYIKESNRLSLQATNKLFELLPAHIRNSISHLITVSCTGFSAPGFDLHLIKELRLDPSIERYHLGFMGCYAAFPAMKMAQNICMTNPAARVLIVNVELCSLHYQQTFKPEIVVSNAIFSDGITACLVSSDKNDSDGKRILLHSFFSKYLQGSEDHMAWKIGDYGFDMTLSYYVPDWINRNINPIMSDLFDKVQIEKDDVEIWAIHPGGKAILKKLEESLGLDRDDFSYSYDVLWEYGNMSSSTIFFVLEKILRSNKKGNIISAAFGPGLTVEVGFMEII
jgi:predicted naringenin-chalcone synthase